MTSDVRCTCVIKKAPTYEVYVQTPCGIHRRMAEDAVEMKINTPEVLDFLEAVKIEAAHQRERWSDTDPHKTDADFYWLIGWLGGKAVTDPHDGNDSRTADERRLHRIITVAAAAYNWHSRAKVRTQGK